MKTDEAYEILGLQPPFSYDEKVIKKKYHSLCLKYHPDKNNNDEDCTHKFQQINEAFQLLTNKNTSENSYENHLYSVLDGILPIYLRNEKIYKVIQQILKTCEKLTLLKLEQLDVNIIEHIFKFLYLHKDLLYINNEVFENIKQIIKQKRNNDQCLQIYPSIEDLFLNNVYKLKMEDEVYLIPLWHKNVVYEHKETEIIVTCYKPTEYNIHEYWSVDDKNNIYIEMEKNLSQLINQENLEFSIGNQVFYYPVKKLHLCIETAQHFILHKQGICKENKNNIFDVSEKADIKVNLFIVNDYIA